MIDARFIEAKRRAAKSTGDAVPPVNNSRRRRGGHRAHDRSADPSVSPPAPVSFPVPIVDPSLNENLDIHDGDSIRPRQGNQPFQKLSPQTQSVRPPPGSRPVIAPESQQQRGAQGKQKPGKYASAPSVSKQSPPIETLDAAASNLSLYDDGGQGQGRPRRFRQIKSNRSKKSKDNTSPQRQRNRTSSEDPRSTNTNRLSMGSRPDNNLGISAFETNKRAAGITVNIPTSQPFQQENTALRLPDVIVPPPASNDSRDTTNLMQSEDTNFGSDISRGIVREGKLYNYQAHEKPVSKAREHKSEGLRLPEDKTEGQMRGVLQIQPVKPEAKQQQGKQATTAMGHRGGLLFIDTSAIKSSGNNANTGSGGGKTTKQQRAPNHSSEFKRNAVPLKKDPIPESQQPRPDREAVSPRIPSHPISLHSGPQLVLTPQDIQREVKTTYREILNLEAKVKSLYGSADDMLETTRLHRRSTHEVVLWTTYCNLHRELLEYYHTFFLMTQHPSASPSVRRLPQKYDMLARYWKFGIVQLLEFLREKLPLSETHMESFIYGAYTLTSLLLEDVGVFAAVWEECLGDLARYLYGIEQNDQAKKDHWRGVARKWYCKTIEESGGVEGRLIHHLGILSKDDVCLQLYYFAKSLTVTHGFSSARESFLILVDGFLGPTKEETWTFLFLRLHGRLFARVELDSFDDDFDTLWSVFYNEEPFSQVYWTRLAIISIASIYQYNRKDSRLKEALRQGRREKRETGLEDVSPSLQPEEPPIDGGPEAILPPLLGPLDTSETDMANVDRVQQESFANIPAANIPADTEDNLSRIIFEKSCILAFSLLSEALQSEDPLATGYVHVWLVFLAYALRYPSVVRLLERHIPWSELAVFLIGVLNWLGDLPNLDLGDELPGPVLPEDEIMRGFEWSRKIFPRGWFEGVEVGEVDDGQGEGEEEEGVELEASRNKRILSLGLQICKLCDCLKFSESENIFIVPDAFVERIEAAKAKEEEEEARLEEAAQAAREAAKREIACEGPIVPADSDEEDVDVPGESVEIRALKARRRELKALLNAHRPNAKKSSQGERERTNKNVRNEIRAGYTVLVFDTNALVSHLDLFKHVLETKEWQIVIPLIVINELDGLKVNPAPLGPAAADAVKTIEAALLARKLRVVTQQGNSLTNLTLRSQLLVSKGTEDGATNIDAFIIDTVKGQAERHSGKVPKVEKAVLITGDKSMRVISVARGVQALTAEALRKELEKPGRQHSDQQNKKS